MADLERVLVQAPRGRDGGLVVDMLIRYGFLAEPCGSADELIEEMVDAACAVLTQEALDPDLQVKLARALAKQPAWSDFPLIILVNPQVSQASQLLALNLGNVTILERPLAPHTLLTAVKAALRARRRQYEARAAIEQRDKFLAMLGHELRNPLAGIVLATQLARSATERAQIEPKLELIARQSKLLARLVDDLLDVARVTTGKVRLRREVVDIDAAIRSSMSALADRARGHEIDVVFSSTSGATIVGDTVRIEQVFNNLLANAIKYSPRGRTVMISSAVEDDTCVIRVRDQGIGIAPEQQSRMFELFAQADGSLDRADGGMGIGLTVVERLVRLHGGSVELISAGIGRGTEVIVRLPYARVESSDAAPDFKTAPAKLRVVLVEDNAELRDLTRELLETVGCTVEVAIDGADGVRRILASKPDLALVDIGLPLLDGYAVAREIRKRLGTSIVLIAVSGYGLEQDRQQAYDAGFDLHVTKPLAGNVVGQVLAFAEQERRRRTTESYQDNGLPS